MESNKAFVGMPTCNIAGILSGYTGEGAKTVLPSDAKAKIDFRLVPDMIPEKQFELIKNHLKDNGFEDDIDIKLIHGEAAIRIPFNHSFVKQVEESAKETFGSAIISISSAGTGPMHPFAKILCAPCVSVGSTYMYAKIHSPNEFARIDLLNKTTKCIGAILDKFAS
jgi:acetylornithine deacetylase/succinyl-diaminopimelate desuccinylase-like protein